MVACLVIAFNRPNLLRRVLDSLKTAPVTQLYVWLDGPRVGNPHDYIQCREVTELVRSFEANFGVTTLVNQENLGCRVSVPNAVSWFLSQEEQGIILEDDCLPSEAFFEYASNQLDQHSNNEKILSISGHSRLDIGLGGIETYLSRYPHIWGWATWQRAWANYDADIVAWDSLRKTNWLTKVVGLKPDAARYWRYKFDLVRQGKADTWDYQLTFLSFLESTLSVIPTHNLVENIGFGQDATHTKVAAKPILDREIAKLRASVSQPFVSVSDEMDRATELLAYRTKRGWGEMLEIVGKRLLPRN